MGLGSRPPRRHDDGPSHAPTNPVGATATRPYEILAAKLRADIKSGSLEPGASVPTCADLAHEHGVSLGTANRAVALLRGEGLVSTRRGQRTVVSVQPESRT
jgi:DNA-binding GntR family transcriptional regulator